MGSKIWTDLSLMHIFFVKRCFNSKLSLTLHKSIFPYPFKWSSIYYQLIFLQNLWIILNLFLVNYWCCTTHCMFFMTFSEWTVIFNTQYCVLHITYAYFKELLNLISALTGKSQIFFLLKVHRDFKYECVIFRYFFCLFLTQRLSYAMCIVFLLDQSLVELCH